MFGRLNAATGTWHNRWPSLYAPHSRRSMEMVSRAISTCEGHGDATILGLGSGAEFGGAGLESLARSFRHLLVVDVDLKTAERTVQHLPAALRRTIELLKVDASGNLVTDFCHDAESAVEESASLRDAINKGLSILRRLNAQDVLPESHADFVCSSLVMTQFASGIERYFRHLLRLRFGGRRKDSRDYSRFLLAVGRLADKINLEHIRNLGRWVRRGGTAYFADTLQELRGISERSEMVQVSWRSAPMFAIDDVDKTLTALFRVRASDKWIWIKKQQAGSVRQHRSSAYLICAYELQKAWP